MSLTRGICNLQVGQVGNLQRVGNPLGKLQQKHSVGGCQPMCRMPSRPASGVNSRGQRPMDWLRLVLHLKLSTSLRIIGFARISMLFIAAQLAVAAQAQTATAPEKSEFAGTAACKTCHPGVVATFFRNPH